MDTPGVGNYNLRKSPGAGPLYGFGSEPKDRPNSAYTYLSTPGPGTYNSKSSINPKKGAFSIVSRKPDLSMENMKMVPGPGAYSPEKALSRSNIRFPLDARDSIAKGNFVPGPGTYEPLFTVRSEKTSMPAFA